jgi:hypothetical protein
VQERRDIRLRVVVGAEYLPPRGKEVLEGECSSRERVCTLTNQLSTRYPHALAGDVGGNTGWCLSTTEADLFAVWLTLGNIVHGEPKNNFYF